MCGPKFLSLGLPLFFPVLSVLGVLVQTGQMLSVSVRTVQSMQQLDFTGRIEKLQQRLADGGLDLLVATRNGTITYLTGTLAPWRTAVLVPVDGKASVITSEYDASRIDDWATAGDAAGVASARSRNPPGRPDARARRQLDAGQRNATQRFPANCPAMDRDVRGSRGSRRRPREQCGR